MLTCGVQHIAVLTKDTDRLVAFYQDMFDATVSVSARPQEGMRLTLLDVGPGADLNVFELEGNDQSDRQTPMFGRGRLDHFGLQAASLEAFNEIRARLMARGASNGFVTDFGPVWSLLFKDPDGLEAEVLIQNPSGHPGVLNPPGTPAPGYEV